MGLEYTCDSCGKIVDRSTGYYRIDDISYEPPLKKHEKIDGYLWIGGSAELPNDEHTAWTTMAIIFCRTCWPKTKLEKFIGNKA